LSTRGGLPPPPNPLSILPRPLGCQKLTILLAGRLNSPLVFFGNSGGSPSVLPLDDSPPPPPTQPKVGPTAIPGAGRKRWEGPRGGGGVGLDPRPPVDRRHGLGGPSELIPMDTGFFLNPGGGGPGGPQKIGVKKILPIKKTPKKISPAFGQTQSGRGGHGDHGSLRGHCMEVWLEVGCRRGPNWKFGTAGMGGCGSPVHLRANSLGRGR